MVEITLMPTINNWSIIYTPIDQYKPREMYPIKIHGTVADHPKFYEGEEITTSGVESAAGRVVKTRNSEYVLGDVDPKYLEWYRTEYPDRTFDPENPLQIP
jgi:hypothetical protein